MGIEEDEYVKWPHFDEGEKLTAPLPVKGHITEIQKTLVSAEKYPGTDYAAAMVSGTFTRGESLIAKVTNVGEDTAEYTVEMLVPSTNKYIGETLGYAGLLNVKGGKLIKMRHFDNVAVPIEENEFIMGGDHMVFAGTIKDILELEKTHKLPIKSLSASSGIPRKTLDRYRKYLIMAVLVLNGDYPFLQEYLKFMKEESRK